MYTYIHINTSLNVILLEIFINCILHQLYPLNKIPAGTVDSVLILLFIYEALWKNLRGNFDIMRLYR